MLCPFHRRWFNDSNLFSQNIEFPNADHITRWRDLITYRNYSTIMNCINKDSHLAKNSSYHYYYYYCYRNYCLEHNTRKMKNPILSDIIQSFIHDFQRRFSFGYQIKCINYNAQDSFCKFKKFVLSYFIIYHLWNVKHEIELKCFWFLSSLLYLHFSVCAFDSIGWFPNYKCIFYIPLNMTSYIEIWQNN